MTCARLHLAETTSVFSGPPVGYRGACRGLLIGDPYRLGCALLAERKDEDPMHKKLVVDVPDDVSEIELRHPSGEVEDIEVDHFQDDDDDEEDDGDE